MMSAYTAATMRTVVAIVLFAIGVATGSVIGGVVASPSSTAPCSADAQGQAAPGATWSAPPQAPARLGQPF